MSALHDAALDYAARGWAVFPLKERDKVPAVAGGFKVATTDEDEIDGAWEHRPALNVGIATGSRIRNGDSFVHRARANTAITAPITPP